MDEPLTDQEELAHLLGRQLAIEVAKTRPVGAALADAVAEALDSLVRATWPGRRVEPLPPNLDEPGVLRFVMVTPASITITIDIKREDPDATP